MRAFAVAVLVLPFLLLGCGRSASDMSHRHEVPHYDLLLENRHDSVVSGWIRFGDVDSVAGGIMRPGEIGAGQHQDLTGGIPVMASMQMSVLPKGETDLRTSSLTSHRSEVPVRAQLPPGFFDGVFYFIIQQDLSLRLVVLTHERWAAMKAQGKRPD